MVFVLGAVGKDSEPETNFSPFVIIFFSSLLSPQCNLAISICGSLIKTKINMDYFTLLPL